MFEYRCIKSSRFLADFTWWVGRYASVTVGNTDSCTVVY